ncbi:hypothetical protein ABC347_07840 [Sphingomonas sp. 1P06PA]
MAQMAAPAVTLKHLKRIKAFSIRASLYRPTFSTMFALGNPVSF